MPHALLPRVYLEPYNIYDGAFLQKQLTAKKLSSQKMLHHKFLIEFLNASFDNTAQKDTPKRYLRDTTPEM